ncbi:hypothetical protein D3C87_2180890 [compost metagenome]
MDNTHHGGFGSDYNIGQQVAEIGMMDRRLNEQKKRERVLTADIEHFTIRI